MVADYLSRDSVMIQHPQYDLVKDFYNANPNPIREYLSNTQGIDIKALYMRHLDIDTLNHGTIGHYFPSHRNPFKLLVQNNGLSHLPNQNTRALLDQTDHYLREFESDHLLPKQYYAWYDGYERDSSPNDRDMLLKSGMYASDASDAWEPTLKGSTNVSHSNHSPSPPIVSSDIEIIDQSVATKHKSKRIGTRKRRSTRIATKEAKRKSKSKNTNFRCSHRKKKRTRVARDKVEANLPQIEPKPLPTQPRKRPRYVYRYEEHTVNDKNTNSHTIPRPGIDQISIPNTTHVTADPSDTHTISDDIHMRNDGSGAQTIQFPNLISTPLFDPPPSASPKPEIETKDDSVIEPTKIMPVSEFEARKTDDWYAQRQQRPIEVDFADDIIDLAYAYPPPKPGCEAFAKLRNLPSPPPYHSPKDTIIEVRQCPYDLRKSTLSHSTPSERHKPLSVREIDGFTNVELKESFNRDIRQDLIDTNRSHNQTVFDGKPTEHVWNANTFLPRYDIPIGEYGFVLSENTHYSRTLLRLKQREDPYLWGIINYLKTGNNLIPKDFPKYLTRFMLSGRYAMDENDILVWLFETSKRPLRVIPSALRQSIVSHIHAGHTHLRHEVPFNLHHGSNRMLQIVQGSLGYNQGSRICSTSFM
ncbi:MAG: hypothetical protein GY938_12515 [Ketobacter sp.]|nr:hypothetical protein [Ketobacter sp.]